MTTTVFHSLQFHDVDRAVAFLEAVGFTRRAFYTHPDEPSYVTHAQYGWRDTGGVMFGSVARPGATDDEGLQRRTASAGHAQCYCVLAADDEVDRVHAAALSAGGTSLQAPADQDYGGRSCTVADPEGNQWSFGSYAGE